MVGNEDVSSPCAVCGSRAGRCRGHGSGMEFPLRAGWSRWPDFLMRRSRAFRQKVVAQDSKARLLTALSKLPMRFEANVGQSDPRVKFLARGNGYSLFLTSDGATMGLRHRSSSSVRTEFVRMRLAGANENAAIGGTELLPGKSNYLIGNDASRWHRNVPQFGGVKYENIYPGINLIFYGNQGRLEYDFQVAAGADPSQAELEFDGLQELELSQGKPDS